MRTRGRRRDLTKRYQERQKRFYQSYNVWDSNCEIQDRRYGSWKTRSWRTCGSRGCMFCVNQRRNAWLSKHEQITLQERKAYESYIAGLNEVYMNYSLTAKC